MKLQRKIRKNTELAQLRLNVTILQNQLKAAHEAVVREKQNAAILLMTLERVIEDNTDLNKADPADKQAYLDETQRIIVELVKQMAEVVKEAYRHDA